MDTLILAAASFAASHLILSMHPVRPALVARLGTWPFRGVYSAISLITFIWLIQAYGDAPFQPVYDFGDVGRHIAYLIMLPATFFVVAGYTVAKSNPMAISAEGRTTLIQRQSGIVTITRHPIMVGVTLWAIAHAVVNGDLASLILTGCIALIAIAGAHNIDLKRQQRYGSDFGPVALTTSHFPFLAAIQGRTQVDWAGIGLWRIALSIAVYAVLVICHQWLGGVALVTVF